jgi:hypothetical protein
MWQGQFEPPWDWRQKNNQLSAETTQSDAFAAAPKIISGKELARSNDSAPSKDCTIKGNINDRGEAVNFTPEPLSRLARASAGFAVNRKPDLLAGGARGDKHF